jgi:DNA-binding transcriptional LysR family regulator
MRPLIDSRRLLTFVTLVRTGSFTRAASELFVTQSAVSHAMRGLEEEVGCLLLNRVGKNAQPTQAGEQLLRHAEVILKEMEIARAALDQLSKWGSARIRIGASITACQYILPDVLRKLKESHPNCFISIVPGDTPQLIESLREHEVDLALGLEPMSETQMEFVPLFNDELEFLVSPQHPWALAGKVERDQIVRESYIFYTKASYTFQMVEDHFKNEEMVLNKVLELASMEAIKEMVKLNLGVSVIAPWIAREEIEEGSLVCLPLGRRKLNRRWGILHLRGRRLSLSEEDFITLCKTVTKDRDGWSPPRPRTGDSGGQPGAPAASAPPTATSSPTAPAPPLKSLKPRKTAGAVSPPTIVRMHTVKEYPRAARA